MAEQDAVTALGGSEAEKVLRLALDDAGLDISRHMEVMQSLDRRGFTLTPLQPPADMEGLRERWAEKLYEAGLSPDFEPTIRWVNLSPSVRQLFFDMADAIIADLAAQGLRVVPGRQPVETAPKEGWFIIEYADGRLAPGHWLDNSKSQWPFAGIRPASMFAEKPNDKIVGWHPLPTTEPGSK